MDDATIKALNNSPAPVDPNSPGSSTGSNAQGAGADTETITQNEFLTLLVHQLQNQDPLNPMQNEEFAVQLAQFSQLEQLVEINKKLTDGGVGGGTGISSMASYLGHEVVLRDQFIQIQSGRGPNILLDVPQGVQSGRVDLLNESGSVVKSIELSELEPGRQVIPLGNLDVASGDYNVQVTVVNGEGQFQTLDSRVTGTVEGFIMEPEPALIVNGVEVPLDQIVEVHLGANTRA